MTIEKYNIPEQKIENSADPEIDKFDWGIEDNNQSIEHIKEIDEILASRDVDQARKLLGNRKLIHSLVVNRGENNSNINRLEALTNLMIQKDYDQNSNIINVPGPELIEVLHEKNISEQVLGEILASAYHKRDAIKFKRVYSIIMECSEKLHNKELIEAAKHFDATWKAEVDKDKQSAVKINEAVFAEAKARDLKILGQKAKFGIALHSGFDATVKQERFEQIRKDMERLEHHYDAHRARIEEIKARVELAGKQTQQNARKDNLDQAIILSREVVDFSKINKYPNLEILAREVQAIIADEIGDKRRANQFRGKKEELIKIYGYLTGDKLTQNDN
jgi:hypothetical protein